MFAYCAINARTPHTHQAVHRHIWSNEHTRDCGGGSGGGGDFLFARVILCFLQRLRGGLSIRQLEMK